VSEQVNSEATRKFHKPVERAWEALRDARERYDEVAGRWVIAELAEWLAAHEHVTAVRLSTEWEYDDQGGYFLTRSASVDADDDEDELGIEFDDLISGLDMGPTLDLFDIERESLGEGRLTREQVNEKAREINA
jgi:hypothetical protein